MAIAIRLLLRLATGAPNKGGRLLRDNLNRSHLGAIAYRAMGPITHRIARTLTAPALGVLNASRGLKDIGAGLFMTRRWILRAH
jgi:hypothetical protein